MVNHLGTLNGKTITLVGDLKYGRTVHSLSTLLSLYRCRLNYVADNSLQIPDEYWKKVEARGATQQKYSSLTKEVLQESDVIYVTRVQKERFPTEEAYNKVKGSYIITKDTLKNCKSTMILMHPLPRVDEITFDGNRFFLMFF